MNTTHEQMSNNGDAETRHEHVYHIPDAPDLLQRIPLLPWGRVEEWLVQPFQTEHGIPIWHQPGQPWELIYPETTFALLVNDEHLMPGVNPGNALVIDSAAKPCHGGWVLALLPGQSTPSVWKAIPSINQGSPDLVLINPATDAALQMPERVKILGTIVCVVR